jgi:hypothetical protein
MSNSQTIQELKNEFMDSKQFTHQAIAKMEGKIGQLANQMGERERGKFPSQPVPNPKGHFVIGSTSAPSHGQEHVQAIATLRFGRQVDNQVAMTKDATKVAKDEETMKSLKEILDQTLSFQLLKRVPRSLFPKLHFQKDLRLPRKAQILMIFWKCLNSCRSTFHSSMPFNKYLRMPNF